MDNHKNNIPKKMIIFFIICMFLIDNSFNCMVVDTYKIETCF